MIRRSLSPPGSQHPSIPYYDLGLVGSQWGKVSTLTGTPKRAITQSLPQEMNPIASIAPVTIEALPLQGIVQSVEPQAIAPAPSPESPKESPAFIPIPEKAENCQAYKVFQAPKPVEEQITPEQWEEAKAKLAALSSKFNFGKGSPRKNSTPHRGVVESHQEAIAPVQSLRVTRG